MKGTEKCNHMDACGDCHTLVAELTAEVADAVMPELGNDWARGHGHDKPVAIPRPDKFLPLYAYSAANGCEILWQTGQLEESEAAAIAQGLTILNAERIRIVRVPGLEQFETPDTLKKLSTSDGAQIVYDVDEEQHTTEALQSG